MFSNKSHITYVYIHKGEIHMSEQTHDQNDGLAEENIGLNVHKIESHNFDDEANENDAESTSEVEVHELPNTIYDEDIFLYPNTVYALVVLSVTMNASGNKVYRIRLLATAFEPIDVAEDELNKFIINNRLMKLNTLRDQMEAISEKLIFNVGDVFTQEGNFMLEIVSPEMTYVDQKGITKLIIGARFADGLVAYKDALEIKASVYGFTDQFPPQN